MNETSTIPLLPGATPKKPNHVIEITHWKTVAVIDPDISREEIEAATLLLATRQEEYFKQMSIALFSGQPSSLDLALERQQRHKKELYGRFGLFGGSVS